MMDRIVEVKGIAFPNKGAEMLLVACLEQLQRRGFLTALEPYSPFVHKLRYPLLTKTRVYRSGVNLLGVCNYLPKFVRDRLGFVRATDLSLALDASGFAYGSPWPTSLAYERLLGERLACPIVLLPQSYGTFSDPKQLKVGKALINKASLIFAREKEGADNLFAVTGVRPRVVPDITFGLSVAPSEIKRDIVIIPNFQVLKRNGDCYIETIVSAADTLLLAGRDVSLMNHEGPKDLEICYRIRESLASKGHVVEVLNPETGLEAKSMIASANFILSSRYHGLIAALSQSIPCYPLGWSYKYMSAMQLFNIEIENSINEPEHIYSRAMSKEYRDLFSDEGFTSRLNSIRNEVESMWDEVFNLIRA